MMTPAAHHCPDPWSFLVCGADPDAPDIPAHGLIIEQYQCMAHPQLALAVLRTGCGCCPLLSWYSSSLLFTWPFPKETHFSLIREKC